MTRARNELIHSTEGISMLVKAHRRNAMLLLVFLCLHFGTHLAAPFGPKAHAVVLEVARTLYRPHIIELLLLASIVVQMILGIALVIRRLRLGMDRRWGSIQVGSGMYLLAFLSIHVSAALSARYQSGLDTNFWWPASTLAKATTASFFYPYYFLAISALFLHFAAALRFRTTSKRTVWGLVVTGPLLAFVILSGYGGWFRELVVPQSYQQSLDRIVTSAQ